MGSKERIQRGKEETRVNILDAALEIVNEDGWQALSMRKIADKIEYTAPIIYEYFDNKEGILLELTRKGNIELLREFKKAKAANELPEKQLEAMWIAYWDYAFANQPMYKLMFGVDTNCCECAQAIPEAVAAKKLVMDTIAEVMVGNNPSEEVTCRKYFTFFSIIHGLISINLVQKGTYDEMNQRILREAIHGIIKSIND
ncbi:TetR/AcrR family transcriptional regulator [Pedobacter sp. AW31-3R]|uniref:TetR/AcrR family transcriptional regulator n=1 Tax=Pedobacter sp. AW31-3R TaxID=3445781 RepID=UPI003FA09CB0